MESTKKDSGIRVLVLVQDRHCVEQLESSLHATGHRTYVATTEEVGLGYLSAAPFAMIIADASGQNALHAAVRLQPTALRAFLGRPDEALPGSAQFLIPRAEADDTLRHFAHAPTEQMPPGVGAAKTVLAEALPSFLTSLAPEQQLVSARGPSPEYVARVCARPTEEQAFEDRSATRVVPSPL